MDKGKLKIWLISLLCTAGVYAIGYGVIALMNVHPVVKYIVHLIIIVALTLFYYHSFRKIGK